MKFQKGNTPWIKGKTHSQESIEKIRLSKIGDNNPAKRDYVREKIREKRKLQISSGMLGKHHSNATKQKISLSLQGHSVWNKGLKNIHLNQETEFKKGNVPWNKGLKGMQVAWNKGIPFSEEAKKKMSMKAMNNKYRLGHTFSDESRKKISNSVKTLWKDENFAKGMFSKFSRKPTMSESKLFNILQNEFPNEWKYVGNGKLWIDGKCPDFINVNGRKQIIEYNGWFTHNEHKDILRARDFAKYGYKTLFLYPKDLKDEIKLKQKLQEFNICQ